MKVDLSLLGACSAALAVVLHSISREYWAAAWAFIAGLGYAALYLQGRRK